MILIKVYDKTYTPLASFLEGDYTSLAYRNAKHEIGDASFTLDISNSKVTTANLRHYNRVDIIENGTVRWTGYIVQKQVALNVVNVRCKSLIGILRKRLVGSAYTLTGDAGVAISSTLTTLNAADPTGITFGTEDLTAIINLTFERQDSFSVLQRVAQAANAQFEVTNSRVLNIKHQIGSDLSSSVVFRYNVTQIDLANILSFQVDDNGDNIVTKVYGKSDVLVSTYQDSGLNALYGLLEKFRDFRVANTQADVDALTAAQIADAAYSPTLDLAPNITDNFEVGDVVRIQVINKLIDIEGNFQILEKSTRVLGAEKKISVRVNALPQDIINTMRDTEDRLALLESNV